MRLIETIAALRSELDRERALGRRVGFVPTMGYLHDGHASLMRRARDECDVVVASIFVNPLQFGAGEDLASYPRDLACDTALAERCGVDLVFAPAVHEMYPRPMLTTVSVREVSEGMEGATRPGHFDGVATVVAKLFAIVGPCRAYFGEKDFQQLQVVRRMVDDLSLPVDVVGCETVREPDGLAMSSRNVYLRGDERVAAAALSRALRRAAAAVAAGERDLAGLRAVIAGEITREPLATLDYAEVLALDGEIRLLVAARVGRARLIDNLGVAVPAVGRRAPESASESESESDMTTGARA